MHLRATFRLPICLFPFMLLTAGTFGQTQFVHTMETALPPDPTSVVYNAGLEILWHEIVDYFPSPETNDCALIRTLTQQVKESNQLPIEATAFYSTFLTASSENIRKIQTDLAAQFGFDWKPPDNVLPAAYIALSYLQKHLVFSREMPEAFYNIEFKDEDLVDYFGYDYTQNEFTRKSVLLHDYRDENDFILQVKCKDTMDQIYFAKIPPQPTLSASYEALQSRLNQHVENLHSHDQLQIPFLHLDTNYSLDIADCFPASAQDENPQIALAQQSLFLDLNESGLDLKVLTEGIIEFGIDDIGFTPRYLLFNQPFLLVLKRKDRERPYFVAWIANADLMRHYRVPQRQLGEDERFLCGRWMLTRKGMENSGIYSFLPNGIYQKRSASYLVEMGEWKVAEGQLVIGNRQRYEGDITPYTHHIQSISPEEINLGNWGVLKKLPE